MQRLRQRHIQRKEKRCTKETATATCIVFVYQIVDNCGQLTSTVGDDVLRPITVEPDHRMTSSAGIHSISTEDSVTAKIQTSINRLRQSTGKKHPLFVKHHCNARSSVKCLIINWCLLAHRFLLQFGRSIVWIWEVCGALWCRLLEWLGRLFVSTLTPLPSSAAAS